MVPIISIVGKTNSGKTTLIEKIIPELKKRGYRVGTIKHDVHQFDIDHKGKDTWRMTQAGANTVVIASDKKLAMMQIITDKNQIMNIDDISSWLLNDVDIIITEGYKKQNKPKIEVTGSGELLCSKDDNLIAIVLNKHQSAELECKIPDYNIPCFELENIDKMVDLIVKFFLLGNDIRKKLDVVYAD